jgi:hypothetical protein
MAYLKEELGFDFVFDKVEPIDYLDEKWSVFLGFENYMKAQLCLGIHNDSDGWKGAERIDCLRRSITTRVYSIIVSIVLEVQVWILSPGNFSTDQVVCFHPTDKENICERLNHTDRDSVAKYLLEIDTTKHDLKKSTSSLKKFLVDRFPSEFTTSTQ